MEKVARFFSFKASENDRLKFPEFRIQNSEFRMSIRLLFIGIIILIAAFLRLYRIEDYMTFLGDEGRDVLVVKDIIKGIESLLLGDIQGAKDKFTLLGPTASVGGFFLGPIYYYFMVPFLWIYNYNPVGPAVMVGLFGVATVFLIYKIGKEFFDIKVGLVAAFLYSISPLVIAHSRSSWNPNIMPFFSLLTLYVLYKAVVKNQVWLFILCGLLLGITMQLHYLATFLGIIAGAYVLLSNCHAEFISASCSLRNMILKQVQDDTRSYLYIFLGFLVGWSPFLAFEIRHGFPNIQSLISFVFNPGEPLFKTDFFGIIYNVFFRLFGRLVTNFPPPEQVALRTDQYIAIWYYATLLLGTVSILFLIQRFVVSLKNREDFQKMSLLVLWLVVGVGLFGFYKKPIYDYYFGFMFPLPFMLVGLAVRSLYTNTHEYVRYIVNPFSRSLINRGHHKLTLIKLTGKVLAVGIFVGLTWVNLQGVPFRFPANRQLRQVEEISRFVISKTDNKPFNFALITGGNSDHAYRYFFTLWGRTPVTIENPQKDPERKTVTSQLLVVCETSPCGVLGHSLWEVAGFGMGEIEKEWNVSVVKVFKLKHYKESSTSEESFGHLRGVTR